MREIISVAQMRAIDAASSKMGVPTRDLMESAGAAVADGVETRFTTSSVLVLCGPGNNGGDGWVAARHLRERGWPVRVATLVPIETLRGDAADAARAWEGETLTLDGALPEADVYVDAMFGAGISRALEGAAAEAAKALAQRSARVVAVDTPSGLGGDTGAPLGDACVRAALTVTFVRKKPAHVLMPGRDLCGDVIVADIGAPEDVVAAQEIALWENAPDLWEALFPWPKLDAHKHARGHVMCASGERLHTGAARLAARGALRAGAGLVTVLSPLKAAAENAAQLTAIMLDITEAPRHYSEAARRADCLVIGPAFGVDPRHSERLHAARTTGDRCPIVFDADALTLLAPLKNGTLKPRDVLTPHVGEFKRLFPNLLTKAPSRIDAARKAAQGAGCVVLLKGPDTVIAAPDGRAIVNTSATPFLATAGAGDVLAGFIAGLVAQGMASFEAAAAGAWLHGSCGQLAGPGLIAEDLPEILPAVLNALQESRDGDGTQN